MNYSISELQQMYRRYRMQVLILLLILTAALVFVFKNHFLTLGTLAAAVLFHLSVVRPQQKEYVNAFTCANLEHTLCPKLGMATVAEKGASHITADVLSRAHLMPFCQGQDTPLLCWELSGRLRGLSVSLCDATLAQDFKLVEKGKKRIHFNSGVWTHIELSKDTGMNLRLLHETSVPTPIRMEFFKTAPLFSPYAIPDEALSKCYVLYGPASQPAPVLPGRFLSELKKLTEYTPGYTAVSIRGSQMDVFIRGRFLARPVSVKQAPAKDLLDFDPFPELLYLLDLAKTL